MKTKRKKAPCILAVVQCIILIAAGIALGFVTGSSDSPINIIFPAIFSAYGILILIFGIISLKHRAGAILLLIFSIFGNMAMIFGIIGGAIGIADNPQKNAQDSPEAVTANEGNFSQTASSVYVADSPQTDNGQPSAYSNETKNEADYGENNREAASRLRLDVYDTIVSNKDWKAFRKGASEEELATLAIGSRYRLESVSFYVKAVISVVGMIFSIAFGISCFSNFGIFAIFVLVGGYIFFNLLASKLIGYSNTYSSCYRKISKEKREFVDRLFKKNIWLNLIRSIVLLFLNIITIPYKFILMAIEILIPPAKNWAIAHGSDAGAVITMPKGYDIGCLGALGNYYASCTFGNAWEEHLDNQERERLSKYKKYTYIDKYGVEQTAYSDDETHFYSSPNSRIEVGTSNDNGKTIIPK